MTWQRWHDIMDAALVGALIGGAIGMAQSHGVDDITAWIAAGLSIVLCGSAIWRMRWSSPLMLLASLALIVTSVSYVLGYDGIGSNMLYDLSIAIAAWVIYSVSGCPGGHCVRRRP